MKRILTLGGLALSLAILVILGAVRTGTSVLAR
jgi:hypothetical protein